MKYLKKTSSPVAVVSGVVLTATLVAGFAFALNLTSVTRADEKPGSASNVETKSPTEAYEPKTKMQLRRELSKLQYFVTQEEGTEKAFRNPYWNNKTQGDYNCIVCDQSLFKSETKFKSGTGWPSFYAPLKKDVVGFREDWKLFYSRTEVHCQRCGAHLGHVFDDGPKPTGKRYCMNSASLKFTERAKNDSEAVGSKEAEETEK